MAAQEPELELLGQLLGDRLRHEAAEAGVDPVRVLARAVGRPLDERARRLHAPAGRGRDRSRAAVDGHAPDVLDGQVLTGEGDRRLLRHPRRV
jgi:hypothetical protein